MAYNFSQFKDRLADVEAWFAKELSSLRTGRANQMVLDTVMVESYGNKQPLKHVAAISLEDAKTLRVTPWDKSQIKEIESGLAAANLGLSVVGDSDGVRVIFPDLTTERRQTLIKTVKEKMEEARISMRKEREKTWNEICDLEKEGKLTEDDKFRGKDELQKIVDSTNEKLEAAASKKEQELLA